MQKILVVALLVVATVAQAGDKKITIGLVAKKLTLYPVSAV